MANLLRVMVRDARGSPVAGARVLVEAAPVPVPDVAALTDARGEAVLGLPAGGRYTIGCAAEGRSGASAAVDVGREGARLTLVLGVAG